MSLDSLKQLYSNNTGLVSDKWSIYLSEYDRLFSFRREDAISLMEIGVQNGGSLEIWSQYFPNARFIIGCDINPECLNIHFNSNKINIIIGDITSSKTKVKISAVTEKLDIVIDDGSHTSSDIIKTFSNFFPLINTGGLFIAEDLHCSYWKEWEGGLNYDHSSISFFKALADIINFEHWQQKTTRVDYIKHFGITSSLTEYDLAEIHSIEFVNSMCIVTRRSNANNILGPRYVTGAHEPVCAIKHINGTLSEPPV